MTAQGDGSNVTSVDNHNEVATAKTICRLQANDNRYILDIRFYSNGFNALPTSEQIPGDFNFLPIKLPSNNMHSIDKS